MIARLLPRRAEVALPLALVGVVALLPKGLPLGVVGLGVVAGCLLALQAMGIVLLYSRTRILSFAQFGLGAGAAVLFYLWVSYNQWAVLAQAVCHCLAPSGPSLSQLQHHPDLFREYLLRHHPWVLVANALISAVLGVLLAAETGRQLYVWIAGVFARAPRIVPTVATLAFASALSGAAVLLTLRTATVFGRYAFGWLPYGPVPGTGKGGVPALPEGQFEAPHHLSWQFALGGGADFHLYDVLAVVLALLMAVLLTVRFRLGRRGLLSRATAANPERAATLGVDVVRETKSPWKAAGALSGLAGILSVSLSGAAPAVGLDMTALTMVLAAVVLARMTSIPLALFACVELAILDQAMFWAFGSHTQFQSTLVLIVAAALLLQRRQTSRADRDAEEAFTTAPEPRRVPDVLRNAPGVHGFLRTSSFLGGALLVGYPLVADPGQLSTGIVLVTFMTLGLSVLVLSGWAGQVSLGQFALAAIAGWVATIVGGAWHLPMPVALLLGALAAMAVAPLVGLPALRLPGPFVAIMTLAFALAVPALLLNPAMLGQALPKSLPRPVLLGLDLSSDRYFYWFALLVLGAALAVVTGLRRSRLRRVLIASRDNQASAEALGIDVSRTRLEAFAVSGFLAGIGGGLLAYATGGVQGDTFSPTNSVFVFLMVVIGGLSAVSGPVLGAVAYGVVQLFGAVALFILQGIGTVIVLAIRPAGLAGLVVGMRDAGIRVIMHLQGHDLLRRSGDGSRIAIRPRDPQAPAVAVEHRLVGDGYAPVAGTRLRRVEGIDVAPAVPIPSPEDVIAAHVDEAVALVSCHRLDVAYQGAVAVQGISLTVAPGEVLAVVGLNGAGKTSLLRALAGLEPAAHGTVELDGEDVTRVLPQDRAERGVAFVPGGASVLPSLTVAENLAVAGGTEQERAELTELFPALAARLDTKAGNLSGGEQQVLAVVQALLRKPRVLLVDELSLGLSPEALAVVLDLVQRRAREGAAVVLVEQSISTAIGIADTALFLESGRVRYQGAAAALRDHPELFASVAFGSGAAVGAGSELTRAQRQLRAVREPVLEVQGLTARYGEVTVVDDVTLELAPGEVVGVLGPNGAGKTTLFDCLSGMLPPAAGTVHLLGNDITGLTPHKRANLGLMRSFQSVRLFPSLTVHDCVAVALETRLRVKSPVFAGLGLPQARAQERRVDERVGELLELLRLGSLAVSTVGSLSLGSRRLVDLACQLAARPKVLLLDEPAAGLAQGETELLGPLVSRISSDLDCAVLIIEHNVQVLASVAHRLVAMRDGAVIAEGAPAAVLSDPGVRSAYFGARADDLVPST